MKAVHVISFVLVVVGAINWGLVGLFNFNLVALVLGSVTWLERLIYVLVGVAGVILMATHKSSCKECAGRDVVKPSTPTVEQAV